ncbi:MAG TPA: hypothetical protein VED16_00905 [Candidatus Acidoferrum sp.]|nr:hypothetical protein [Candidatus Acidoferrum sp.]
MLALIPCIGPVISLLLGITFLNPVTAVARDAIIATPALTPFGAVFLAAIF